QGVFTMWPISWLDPLRGARPGRAGRSNRPAARRRRTTAPPLLELLEDRIVPSFFPAVNYPVGPDPRAVSSADFNGAGRLDQATPNSIDNTVSVLLGNGDGTFQAARTSSTGQGPVSLAVGDFNGDGKLDLVTANGSDLSVLLGKGDGTFDPASSAGLPAAAGLAQTPLSVVVGDLNKDGKLDLVATGQTSDTTTYYGYYGGKYYNTFYQDYANVLLGDGSGGFTPGDAHALGSGPRGPGPAGRRARRRQTGRRCRHRGPRRGRRPAGQRRRHLGDRNRLRHRL